MPSVPYKIPPVLYAVFSGVLLFLSYPPFSYGAFAWIALIFLLASVRGTASRLDAFGAGFAGGLAFFIVSLQWFWHVTALGWLLASAIEALFMGGFAVIVFEVYRLKPPVLVRIFLISLAWVFVEVLRAHWPILGFAWNLLGNSQAFFGRIIQTANVFGVYGLSFAVACVNVCFFEMIEKRKEWSWRAVRTPVMISAGIFLLIFSHGAYHQKNPGRKTGDLRISLIQGNIPQSVKWELVAREKILEIYSALTQLAGYDEPELIIWPEAAFPGYFNRDLAAQETRDQAEKMGIPILVGTTLLETQEIAYNSALLVNAEGKDAGRYDKLYLVPFGEYMPFQNLFPWFTPFAESLGISNFTAGREKTVFRILNGEIAFSSLICFEDTFPDLARDFVQRGAQFLAVITNDAWFGKTGAAAQHLQASILRAVETGVPAVRAANTGISAFISNRGEVLGQIEDASGNPLFVTGRKTMALPLESKETLFMRGGWVFPYVASGLFVMMFLFLKVKSKR